MSAMRSRQEYLTYKKHLKLAAPDVCAFCTIAPDSDQKIEQTKHFKVLRNIFPYSIWDGQRVVDHLLITPQQHTNSLTNMPGTQKIEYVDLIEKYEQQGYNIYARAPGSVIKSVVHQHTHLIKTADAPKHFILLLRRPYLRIAA